MDIPKRIYTGHKSYGTFKNTNKMYNTIDGVQSRIRVSYRLFDAALMLMFIPLPRALNFINITLLVTHMRAIYLYVSRLILIKKVAKKLQ